DSLLQLDSHPLVALSRGVAESNPADRLTVGLAPRVDERHRDDAVLVRPVLVDAHPQQPVPRPGGRGQLVARDGGAIVLPGPGLAVDQGETLVARSPVEVPRRL